MGNQIQSFSDLVYLCIREHLDPAVLSSFREFLSRNSDREWLIVSDYHVEKGDPFENYVWVFTVLPYEQHRLTLKDMDAGLPTKLSQSSVTESDIKFLRELNHFSFIFVSDKKFRPAAATMAAGRASTDISIQRMRSWTNAANCTNVINEFVRLRQAQNATGFNLKLLNQATLSASCVSAIALIMLQTIQIETINWLSDRDAMIDNLDGIVYTMFHLNMLAFYQHEKLTPFNLVWFGEAAGQNPQAKKKPLPLAPYIRVPDYLAAPIALSELRKQGVQHVANEKYQRILAFVVADNPNIAVLRLVNDPGWGLARMKISLDPPHSEIAKLAYWFWMERGSGHGNDLRDWFDAEKALTTR